MTGEKNILVYINDSLGELDWIAPYMQSEEARDFCFYIYLNGPGSTYDEKIKILQRYGLGSVDNIHCVNRRTRLEPFLFQIDMFLNRVLGRIKLVSFHLFEMCRSTIDGVRWLLSRLPLVKSSVAFDVVFRDYNLKESFALSCFIRHSPQAKIVIYPHAVGLQRKHEMCPREPAKQVQADLWLENSDYSDIMKYDPYYQKIFFASGVPGFDINYKRPALFNIASKKAVIITRDCSMTFGFTYEMAMKAFDELLEKLGEQGYQAYIKHHPRDRELKRWRKIQQKYQHCYELEESLNTLTMEHAVCFTLFSTAPLFLLSRGVPVLEFSPYKQYDAYQQRFPMHYKNENGETTHDLLSLKLFDRIDVSTDDLSSCLEASSLKDLALRQYKVCQTVFPPGANQKITMKLQEITDGR